MTTGRTASPLKLRQRRITTAAIRSPSFRTGGWAGCWLSVRHSFRAEAAAALTLYGLYELGRAVVGADTAEADRHAHRVVALERSLHLFVEANVQRAVQTVPGLTSLFGVAYLTLHLAVTAGVLFWLHRRRPEGFPFVRTALLLASGLALVGFLVYPTAPPRLAGVGIVDTVSGRHVDLNRGLVSSLYNPYAAVPSMHVGYALIVAGGLLRHGRGPLVRAIAALYPLFVLLVIVATPATTSSSTPPRARSPPASAPLSPRS
jgi:PAP2 superfamily protein